MSAEVVKVLTFADHIPATANPFLATSTVLEDVIKGTVSSPWTRLMAKLCIAGCVLMIFQATILLLQRLRLNTFGTVRSNKLGLLTVNKSEVTIVIYSLYALLTVAFLSAELAVQKEVRFEGIALVIFQCKFVFILMIGWIYLWACVCRCAELLWESDWVAKLSSRNQETLRITLKWGMSLFIISVTLVPIPITIWASSKIFVSFSRILAIIWEVKAGLLAAATTYNPATYTKVELFQFFIPAQRVLPVLILVEKHVSLLVKLYVSLLTLWIVIYLPSLFLSLRCLYKRLALQAAKDAALGPGGKSQPSTTSRRIRRQTRQLVHHAVAVFLCVLVHYPVLIWLARNSSVGFISNQKWRIVCYYGLSVPFSITGNVVLVTLNSHSRDMLRERQKVESGTPSGTPTQASNSSTGVGKTAFNQFWSLGPNSQVREKDCEVIRKEIPMINLSATPLESQTSLAEATHGETQLKLQAHYKDP